MRPLALAAFAAFLSFATPAVASQSPAPATIETNSFASAAGTLQFDVYLPPDYESSGLRYPVIYYLHGLPAGPLAFHTASYVAKAAATAGLQAIIVAPQGATATHSDPEYLDAGPGDDWETAIAVQLPRVVDSLYRTIPDRTGRAIVGVSAGGYGAMLLGLHHLGLYSAIESWSGYFHPTDPTGTVTIDSRPWLSAHSFVGSLERAFVVHPTFVGFYVGSQDNLFRPENIEFARQLSRAKVPFMFRMYPGGHQQHLWSTEAPLWLTMLTEQLAQPTPNA
jgi:S-formylglutathione hydrolase FrmB